MQTEMLKRSSLALVVAALAACGGDEAETSSVQSANPPAATVVAAAPEPATPAADDCPGEQGLNYICGLQAAEDLLLLDSVNLILTSGMTATNTGPGHMYLIDPETHEVSELLQGQNFTQAHDTALFPDCPGPLNRQNVSVHGLSIAEIAPQTWSVYTTSHGDREAVEVYELAIAGDVPALTWKGCVVLPENTFSNSVARLDDGGFLVTKMMDTTQGFGAVNAGEITGNVFEWHPGGEVSPVEGTELSGANGVTVSPDGRYIYVAALGSRELVRYDTSTMPMAKDIVSVDITPDNIRWNDAGMLLVAGGNAPPAGCAGPACQTGWGVLEVDPQTLAVTRIGGADQNAAMQGASSALQVGSDIWVGTFNDDRVAWFVRQ